MYFNAVCENKIRFTVYTHKFRCVPEAQIYTGSSLIGVTALKSFNKDSFILN